MIEDLKAQIVKQRVVIFVGTGVSQGAAQTPLAGWKGFLKAGIRLCEATQSASLPADWAQRQRAALEQGDLDEWLNVAEAISRKLVAPRGGEFRRWLRETVGALEVIQPGVIDALAALGAPLVTTNYDDLLEDVTRRGTITWRQDNLVTKFVQERQLDEVLHLHGHWKDSESIILGVRSYEGAKEHEHLQITLRTLLMNYTAVFVGYGDGLTDPNFEPLRTWAARVLGGSEHRHYRLCKSTEAKALAQLHKGERILPLVYGDSHENLEPFLRSLAPNAARAADPR